jgi:hypothetical protein
MDAGAWAVVFVLDGFVAPIQAAAVLESGSTEALQAFAANQEFVIRLGLVSWLLVGAGVLFLGIGLLTARKASRGIRVGLGMSGIRMERPRELGLIFPLRGSRAPARTRRAMAL